MPNLTKIMQQVANAGRTWRIKTVPGAIALFEHGKPKIFFGLPLEELFPEAGAVRKWLARSQDAAADDTWEQMFGGGHLAPAREPVIEGLAHGGVAQRLRKIFTCFGSGWQGHAAKDSFERVVGRNFPIGQETLDALGEAISPHISASKVEFLGGGQEHMVFDLGEKVVKIGYGAEQFHPNIPEVLQPHASGFINAAEVSYKGGLHYHVMPKVDTSPISYAEVTSMASQLGYRGYQVDEAIGNWGTHQGKKVLIDVGGMKKLSEAIMDTGEGAAAAQAGTSTVKAIFKAGSRVIKNGL